MDTLTTIAAVTVLAVAAWGCFSFASAVGEYLLGRVFGK